MSIAGAQKHLNHAHRLYVSCKVRQSDAMMMRRLAELLLVQKCHCYGRGKHQYDDMEHPDAAVEQNEHLVYIRLTKSKPAHAYRMNPSDDACTASRLYTCQVCKLKFSAGSHIDNEGPRGVLEPCSQCLRTYPAGI